MIIYDRDKILEWLNEISLRPCDFSRPEDYDDNMTEDLAMGAINLLTVPHNPRLLTVEEVQNLKDRNTVCVEQLFSRENDERGYVTGKGWGIMCNSTGKKGEGLLVSILGTFFPDVVRKIPYKALVTDKDTKKGSVNMFRFWTDRPTDEQSKAVPWDE